jgi:hypothetical protein
MELDDDTPAPRSPSKPLAHASQDSHWQAKYFGDVIVKGYALASASTFVKLKTGDPVNIIRVKPSSVSVVEGKKSAAAAKKLENDVVRCVTSSRCLSSVLIELTKSGEPRPSQVQEQ